MKKFEGLLYALMIGAGFGLTMTFSRVPYPLYIKIIGLVISLSMLLFGMIGNYRFNHKK